MIIPEQEEVETMTTPMTGRHTLSIGIAAGGVVCLIATSVLSCGGGMGGH